MYTKEFEENILDQIIYRGEGNSSIVIALKSKDKVIRLLKKDGKIMKSSQDHHVTYHPMRSLQFIHVIMKPLTEPFLGGVMELIHLKSDFINSLSERVEAHRPSHRLDKTLLLDDQYALFMDDLCTLPPHINNTLNPLSLFGPTISIEIKPKQGFLPIHKLIMKSSNEQSCNKLKNCCIYGSTQYLKLARGKIGETSNYCPINLFSGCPVKMRQALESLIRNPQNNLRIFKDLVLAYGETSNCKLSTIFNDFFESNERSQAKNQSKVNRSNEDRLVDLVIQSLLNLHEDSAESKLCDKESDFENSFNNSESCLQHTVNIKCKRCEIHPSTKKLKSESLQHKLPKNCVLSSILRAQKLDTIGAHEALRMLEWLIEDSRSSSEVDILEELSRPQLPEGFGATHPLPMESEHQYYFRKVWEFLVSLTAKDCSIIITMRRVSLEACESTMRRYPEMKKHLLKEHKSGNYYMFNVGIADLDQKMPLKIPRICENLNLIQSARKELVKNEPVMPALNNNQKIAIV